jgi:hypothetical protein
MQAANAALSKFNNLDVKINLFVLPFFTSAIPHGSLL